MIYVIKRLSGHAYMQTGQMKPSQASVILELHYFPVFLLATSITFPYCGSMYVLFIYDSSSAVYFFLKTGQSHHYFFLSQKLFLTMHFKICFQATSLLSRKLFFPFSAFYKYLFLLPSLLSVLLLHFVTTQLFNSTELMVSHYLQKKSSEAFVLKRKA